MYTLGYCFTTLLPNVNFQNTAKQYLIHVQMKEADRRLGARPACDKGTEIVTVKN